jgi:hypothetical protein
MKNILLLSALAFSLYGLAGAQADSTNAPPVPAPQPLPVQHISTLSPEENREVNKAHSAALFADPSLAAEERKLLGIFQEAYDAGESPGPEVIVELKDFSKKLCAAMVKIDPKIEPLVPKLPFLLPKLHTWDEKKQSPPSAQ